MGTFHIVSTFTIVLLAIGIASRRNMRLHMRIMVAAFAIDIATLLAIELSRGAIERVVSTPKPLVWIHVGISVLVVVAYFVQLRLGSQILRGNVVARATHVRVGVTFCALRLANYFTSFAVQ